MNDLYDNEIKSFIERSLVNIKGGTNSSINPTTSGVYIQSPIQQLANPFMGASNKTPSQRRAAPELPTPPSDGIYILGARNGKIDWFSAEICQ